DEKILKVWSASSRLNEDLAHARPRNYVITSDRHTTLVRLKITSQSSEWRHVHHPEPSDDHDSGCDNPDSPHCPASPSNVYALTTGRASARLRSTPGWTAQRLTEVFYGDSPIRVPEAPAADLLTGKILSLRLQGSVGVPLLECPCQFPVRILNPTRHSSIRIE